MFKTDHSQPCENCSGMHFIAQEVLDSGYAILSQVYRKAFPGKKYKVDIAKRRVLQMPLVALRAGDVKSGTSTMYLIEHAAGVDYVKLQQFIDRVVSTKTSSNVHVLDKKTLT